MSMRNIYDRIVHAVLSGSTDMVRNQMEDAISRGFNVMDILNHGLLRAMHIVGDRFERNEIYVTELLVSARCVQAGVDVIRPYLLSKGEDIPEKGKVVIGTVSGDLHDIGKNLLIIVLEAKGYNVIDLGVDVSSSAFVEAVSRHQPDIVALSALLTTTVKSVGDTIEALSGLKESGHRFSVVVGGASLSEDIASALGADGYAPDAVSGGKLIDEIVEREKEITSGYTLSVAYSLEEIEAMQVAFKDLTGLNMVILDSRGVPLVGGEAFAACSHSCRERTNLLGQSHLTAPMHSSMMAQDHDWAVAYRCRCGMMELSYSLNGEDGNMGTILCGHFLLEGDLDPEKVPADVLVLTETQCDSLCRYLGVTGRKIVELVDNSNARIHMEGQQKTYMDFMKKQRQLEEDLKAAQLSALQYQVNPHFLFNSLNTIARVALIEGDKHTEKLVSALARLMRYSLYQVKSTVTLEEEVKTVNDYLMIQETRFQGRLSHRIDIEPSVLMAKMPCMILQPLVENACQHGLEPTKRGGIITIQGWLENGNVFLEVTDNGVGMSEEQQRSIFNLEDIQSTKKDKRGGIGMNNVLSRLQYHFGSDCAWDIHSVLNKGTTLQISFPLNNN
ncbi:MAG: histidine kinase [Firmicutes bacterium]|nr:histidine kinase [Bacillota bacterium]